MTRFFLLILLVLLTACSTSSVVVAPQENALPTKAHFLPIALETDVAREHQSIIERSTLAALRNRGFLLSSGNEQEAGVPKVQVTIASLRRDSVLAGHVNRISGTIEFFNERGEVIAASKHTESERGGVLFNSGQVLKGILSEVNNLDGSGFEAWINRFAEGLAKTLPKPALNNRKVRVASPEIRAVEVSRRGRVEQICLEGTEGNRAFLRLNGADFPLRDAVGNGEYCLALPATVLANQGFSKALLFLESPFGVRASKQVALTQLADRCVNLKVSSQVQSGRISFYVTCGDVEASCAMSEACKRYAFRLYEVQENGAFALLEEFTIEGYTQVDTESSGQGDILNRFRIFQVDPKLKIQRPVQLTQALSSGADS